MKLTSSEMAIATAMVFAFTRCVRSTGLVVVASLVAVVWQLGMLPTLGFSLDPYSILVPFLVFAIGMSHGAQKMNGIMQDVGRGTHRLVAARYTFRRLFLAGMTALLADAVGFAVLMVIDIPVIRDLALTASVGVAVLIVTNLILLPVLLSYVGVLSHVALDLLNNYGVRLFMPFSNRWFYGDAVFIIDPWLWLTLGAGIWLARRRGIAVAARHSLTLALIYIVAMVLNARLARDIVLDEWRTTRGGAPVRLMAGPTPVSVIQISWRLGQAWASSAAAL